MMLLRVLCCHTRQSGGYAEQFQRQRARQQASEAAPTDAPPAPVASPKNARVPATSGAADTLLVTEVVDGSSSSSGDDVDGSSSDDAGYAS